MMRKLLFTLAFAVISSASFSQVINTFPYVEDFESWTTCGTGGGTACVVPTPWLNNTTTDNNDWTVDVNGTGSGSTGPTANGGADHNPGVAGGRYLYYETSSPTVTGETIHLESPWFDFTALTAPILTYWYHMYGTSMGTMQLDVRNTLAGGGPWTTIVAPHTDNQDIWQEQIVSLLAFAGEDSVQVRWHGIRGTSFGSDMAIDDIMVFQPADVDLAAASVDSIPASACGLGLEDVWTTIEQNGAVGLIIGDTIFANYADGTTTINDTIILAAPLTPGATYNHMFSQLVDYSVPATYNITVSVNNLQDPNNGDDTTYATVINIPVVNTFPYLENFESGQGGWVEDNTVNGSWAFGTPAKATINSAASGVNAWTSGGLTGIYNPNENSWVNGPCFDFSTLDSGSFVSLKIWRASENSWDGSNLQWSSDNGVSWNNIGAFGSPNNWYNDNTINGNPGGSQEGWTSASGGWIQAKHLLPDTLIGMPSARLRFTFGSDGSVQMDGIAFDDFSIGLPDSLDSALFVDYSGCSPLDIDYLETGFYSWAIQDTATLAIDTTFYTYSGAMSFLQSGTTDTTFNLIVNYVDASGCFPHTDTMLFTIAPVPTVDLGADTTICWDASVQYNAPIGVNYTYVWSDLSVADSALFTTGGYIGVTVTDTLFGCAGTDSVWIIQTAAVDIPTVTANVCAGDSVMVDAGAPYDVYTWSTSEATQTVYLSTPGTYYVTATDSIGCMSTDSVEITTSLPVPAITGVVDTICSNGSMVLDAGAGFSSYSWTTSGSAQTETISGASLPLGDNTVTVTVTDGNGCSNTDAVTFNIDGCAGLNDLNAIAMSIYPNPSTGEFTYSIENMTGNIDMMIVDLSGKIIDAGKINASTGIIDLTNYENGIYILRLQAGNAITSVRLVKQ